MWILPFIAMHAAEAEDTVLFDDPHTQDVQLVVEPGVFDAGAPLALGVGAQLHVMDGDFPLGLDARGFWSYYGLETARGARRMKPKRAGEAGLSLVIVNQERRRDIPITVWVERWTAGYTHFARIYEEWEPMRVRHLVMLRGGAQAYRAGLTSVEDTLSTVGGYAGIAWREDRNWGAVFQSFGPRTHSRTYSIWADALIAARFTGPTDDDRVRTYPVGARVGGSARFVRNQGMRTGLGAQVTAEVGIRPWIRSLSMGTYAQLRVGLVVGGGRGKEPEG